MFRAQNQCVLIGTLVFAQIFNLSDKNLIQLCLFQRELKQIDFLVLWRTAGSIFSLTWVQTMGAVCAFDQGHVYVDDNKKSAGCPKSVVTLPSKYTCFSFSTSPFLQLSLLCWLRLLFFFLSRSVSVTNSILEVNQLIINSDNSLVQQTKKQLNELCIRYLYMFLKKLIHKVYCSFMTVMLSLNLHIVILNISDWVYVYIKVCFCCTCDPCDRPVPLSGLFSLFIS